MAELMHCTVAELLNRISSEELTHWKAYFDIKEKEAERQRTQGEKERKAKADALELARQRG